MFINKNTLAIAIGAFGLAGCASITQGTTQTMIFSLDPKQARCTLTRDGDGELGTVTGNQNTITVGKDKDDIVVSCRAEGYENKTMRLVSSTQTAGVVGGVFLDLGITDMITGAMWKYPGDVSIVMELIKATTSPSAAAPVPAPAITPNSSK